MDLEEKIKIHIISKSRTNTDIINYILNKINIYFTTLSVGNFLLENLKLLDKSKQSNNKIFEGFTNMLIIFHEYIKPIYKLNIIKIFFHEMKQNDINFLSKILHFVCGENEEKNDSFSYYCDDIKSKFNKLLERTKNSKNENLHKFNHVFEEILKIIF